MLIEQLVFMSISIFLFVILTYKMIKKYDKIYVIVLILNFIGFVIDILSIIFKLEFNIYLFISKYILSIAIPVYVIIVESGKKYFPSVFRLFMAQMLFKLKNNKSAKKILHKVIKKDENNYNAHNLLAKIYDSEGGSRKAIDEYVRSLDIEPKDYDSYFRVAYLLNDLGKTEDSQHMLESLLKSKPEYAQATILLSDILIQNEKYKEALTVLLDGHQFNLANYDICYNLGIAYTMLNDFPNAKQFYEKAAQINALSAVGKYNLAQIELIYKNIEKAQQIFLELIDQDILSADSYCEIAKIYLIKNQKDMAIRYANMAIELNPKEIIPKIKKDQLFISILAKLSMPFNFENPDDELEEENKKQQFKQKEYIAKTHLEEIQDITRNLSYSDLEIQFHKATNSGKYKVKDESFQQDDKQVNEIELVEKERDNPFNFGNIETPEKNLTAKKSQTYSKFSNDTIDKQAFDIYKRFDIDIDEIKKEKGGKTSLFKKTDKKDKTKETIKENLNIISNIKQSKNSSVSQDKPFEVKLENICDEPDIENGSNLTSKISNSKYDIDTYLNNYKSKYASKNYTDYDLSETNSFETKQPKRQSEKLSLVEDLYLEKEKKAIEDITSDFRPVYKLTQTDESYQTSREENETKVEHQKDPFDCFSREETIILEKYLNNINMKNTTKEEYKQYLISNSNKKHIKDIEMIERNRY